MAIRICGDNTVASPAITSASDTDTGLQFGTNEVKVVNGNLDITDGNLIVAAGHGIDFSDTANSSGTMVSELLDDYEEGTWTPNVSGSTSGSVTSFGEKLGSYTKIGDRVHAEFYLANPGTNSGVTGNWLIGGLPYAADNLGANYYGGGASHWDRGVPYNDFLAFTVNNNVGAGTSIIIVNGIAGTPENDFITGSIPANLLIRGSVTYISGR